jgi:hypothetical protein
VSGLDVVIGDQGAQREQGVVHLRERFAQTG